jgi:hypothetical protein
MSFITLNVSSVTFLLFITTEAYTAVGQHNMCTMYADTPAHTYINAYCLLVNVVAGRGGITPMAFLSIYE